MYRYNRNVATEVAKSLASRGLSSKIVFGRKPVVEGEVEDFALHFLLNLTPEQISAVNKTVESAEGEVLITFSKVDYDGTTRKFRFSDYDRAPHKMGTWVPQFHEDGAWDALRGYNEDVLQIVFQDVA